MWGKGWREKLLIFGRRGGGEGRKEEGHNVLKKNQGEGEERGGICFGEFFCAGKREEGRRGLCVGGGRRGGEGEDS